ncbi:MAG: hypothetical protein QM784_38250 [Polyangiaceae bacterium]
MDGSAHSACAIVHDADVYHVRGLVRRLAKAAGADRRECAELEIVASELARNILRHVGEGRMEVRAGVAANGRATIAIHATDGGPALELAVVLQDGWSRNGMIGPDGCLGRGGIGCGLGAVKRLTNHLEQVCFESGKTIVATRILKARPLP